MENIYTLGEKYLSISEAYDSLQAVLDQMYEENGGEVTEETEAMESEKETLALLRETVVANILDAPDDYAAIVKNTEAQKAIEEAELKAIMEQQAKVVAKYKARINSKQRKIDWFKDAIASAMRFAEITKIGGARTSNKFSIYFTNTKKLEADNDTLLAPYRDKINAVLADLPVWVSIKPDINKALLKKEEDLPDGAELIETKTLQIR